MCKITEFFLNFQTRDPHEFSLNDASKTECLYSTFYLFQSKNLIFSNQLTSRTKKKRKKYPTKITSILLKFPPKFLPKFQQFGLLSNKQRWKQKH